MFLHSAARHEIRARARQLGYPRVRIQGLEVRGSLIWAETCRDSPVTVLRQLHAALEEIEKKEPQRLVPMHAALLVQAPATRREALMADVDDTNRAEIGRAADLNCRLDQFPAVTPTSRQFHIVQTIYEQARRHVGFRLPEHVRIVFVDAPPDKNRGLCIQLHAQAEIDVYLRIDLQERELAVVAAHEFSHAHDMATGKWESFEEWHREERADRGASRLVERCEDDGVIEFY